MNKYAIDRLNDSVKAAVDEGIIPGSVYTSVRLHLERRSRELAPQTEAKEILEDIEEIQCYVSDWFNDDEYVQQQLASLWCRVDELKGMVTVNG
jgi:hypothetical protein